MSRLDAMPPLERAIAALTYDEIARLDCDGELLARNEEIPLLQRSIAQDLRDIDRRIGCKPGSASLLSAIALPELTGTATVINSRTLLYVQTFSVTLVAYLVLSNVLSWLASQLGARMFHPPLIVRPRAGIGGRLSRRATHA